MKGEVVEIRRTQVVVYVDKNHIHLLDLDSAVSLTNALGMTFCKLILNHFGLIGDLSDYDFICYHTDSTITIFDPIEDVFQFPTSNDSRIDKDFKKEMYYMYS